MVLDLVCHLLKTGVAAIFGPQSAHTASHVQSICDTMEVCIVVLIQSRICLIYHQRFLGAAFRNKMGLPDTKGKLFG